MFVTHTLMNNLFARYCVIASLSASGQESSDVIKQNCVKILKASNVESSGFQIGITKVLSICIRI